MVFRCSATSLRNCSTSSLVAPSLVAPVGADPAFLSAGPSPWAWANQLSAMTNSTSTKHVVSGRMFFLSQKNLANRTCPEGVRARKPSIARGPSRQPTERYVYCLPNIKTWSDEQTNFLRGVLVYHI